MILNLEHLPRVIPVGIQTESGVEAIGFDLSPWLTRWPDLIFAVWPTRPGERASYIAANTEMVGNVLYWYPNAADTEKEGAGTVEVVGIGGGKCKSSGVIDTLVKKTSLDVTQETPEPMKLWAEKVMQAASEVKASVDAGEGGIYIVNTVHEKGVAKTDRTPDEIKAAARAGKTVLLSYYTGEVYIYNGTEKHPIYPETDPDCPSFVHSYKYVFGEGIYDYKMHIRSNRNIEVRTSYPMATPNPKKLTIKQGNKTAEYNGSNPVTVEIPDSIPDPGKAFQQLVSDVQGNMAWKPREFYDEDAKEFPWNMVPDADAPSAVIYKSDGTDSGIRWVKVSDYTPDAERIIGHGEAQISEYSTVPIKEDNIFDCTENGYLIAQESPNGLRRIFAVVCFKAGYVVNGFPAYQRPENHMTTLPEPGLYLPVTSNEQTYYGIMFDEYVKHLDDKYIPDSIARKKDLENIKPSDSVTDEHINSLIDNKLAGFGGVYLLGKQELAPMPDGNGFAITTPWANPIFGGAVYKVNYNGTDYECECIALPENIDTPAGMFVMGNLSAPGMEGGNSEAPFAIVMYENGMGGLYGGVLPTDGATAVTLSIRSTAAGYYFYDGNVAKIVTIDQLKADLGLT